MARLDKRALRRWEQDADSGDAHAQFNLGLVYSTGHGVGQDLVVAHKWFNLAAAQGEDEARSHRLDLADQMSAADIAAAQRLAREWMTTRR